MIQRLIQRLFNRAARELVTRFDVHPARVGWRHVPPVRITDLEHRVVHPAGTSTAPLPRNVASRDALSRDRRITGFSFDDVPQRELEPTIVAEARDCRILIATDVWGDRHYAILTRERRQLHVRGTYFQRALHAPLVEAPAVRMPHATWILEAWDRNYAHWLQWHLTKIVLLEGTDDFLIPPRTGFAGASLDLLHAPGIELPGNVIDVERLTVIGMDSYRPSLLRALRAQLATNAQPARRLFISRRDASRRRLLNEDRCWSLLESHGFERVFMEDHSFAQQVAMMQEAAAVVALHGAGLANILFAPEGAHVVEIADEAFPNPQYYALSACMGHHYWLLQARPAGEYRPGYHDLVADEEELARVLPEVVASL
ncbi:MAG TPA: glycosyltransferase family 61 protein [Thermoanaerobaculia bacterium]|nr:glycosyltransferase family 61 protein [Thermoanaerobaculia bacterium]